MDTSDFAKKIDLASLNSAIDELNLDKLNNVLVSLSKTLQARKASNNLATTNQVETALDFGDQNRGKYKSFKHFI